MPTENITRRHAVLRRAAKRVKLDPLVATTGSTFTSCVIQGSENEVRSVTSTATGTDSTAVGTDSAATGTDSTAIGTDTAASGDCSLAVGTRAAAGDNAVAVGCDALAGDTGTAIGTGTTAAVGALAIGNGATASVVGSMKLASSIWTLTLPADKAASGDLLELTDATGGTGWRKRIHIAYRKTSPQTVNSGQWAKLSWNEGIITDTNVAYSAGNFGPAVTGVYHLTASATLSSATVTGIIGCFVIGADNPGTGTTRRYGLTNAVYVNGVETFIPEIAVSTVISISSSQTVSFWVFNANASLALDVPADVDDRWDSEFSMTRIA